MKRIQFALVALAVLCLVATDNAQAGEQEDINLLKQQVLEMKAKIEALERRINAKNEPAEAAASVQARSERSEPKASGQQTSVAARGENSGNPAISVIGTFNAHAVRGGVNAAGGRVNSREFLPLSEAEIIFGAEIDPHARLDITMSASPGTAGIEEGFITARLPRRINLLAGRKFLPFGLINEVHPHALIYADTPNGLTAVFGTDKFTGDGVLFDLPLFVGDSAHALHAGFFSTQNDVAFDTTGGSRFAGLGRWTSLWDIMEDSTLAMGASYVQGRNGAVDGSNTRLVSGHFALKNFNSDMSHWHISGEWDRRYRGDGLGLSDRETDGAYLLGQYGFNRHWRIFGRYDYVHEQNPSQAVGLSSQAWTGGLAWKLSEFQSLTLQYKYNQDAFGEIATQLGVAAGQSAHEAFFRWVVAIGPHPAHPY